jgi:hypothetical protein
MQYRNEGVAQPMENKVNYSDKKSSSHTRREGLEEQGG